MLSRRGTGLARLFRKSRAERCQIQLDKKYKKATIMNRVVGEMEMARMRGEKEERGSTTKRADILSDLGFVFGTLYRFSRDLEGVITRMAQLYRGGVNTADETMIPGITANLSRSVHGLLLRGGEKPRKELQDYLESLRVWSGICLTAYKSGAKLWCRPLGARLLHPHWPVRLQPRAGPRAFRGRGRSTEPSQIPN